MPINRRMAKPPNFKAKCCLPFILALARCAFLELIFVKRQKWFEKNKQIKFFMKEKIFFFYSFSFPPLSLERENILIFIETMWVLVSESE